jgi:hypothetical protein
MAILSEWRMMKFLTVKTFDFKGTAKVPETVQGLYYTLTYVHPSPQKPAFSTVLTHKVIPPLKTKTFLNNGNFAAKKNANNERISIKKSNSTVVLFLEN